MSQRSPNIEIRTPNIRASKFICTTHFIPILIEHSRPESLWAFTELSNRRLENELQEAA
jgi:hypothetical protein